MAGLVPGSVLVPPGPDSPTPPSKPVGVCLGSLDTCRGHHCNHFTSRSVCACPDKGHVSLTVSVADAGKKTSAAVDGPE